MSRPRVGPCLRALSFVFAAAPARADGLEGENTYCVLLGLTLVGILGGWALLFRSAKGGRVPADSGLAVLAVPTLYVSLVAFFPPPERLMVVAPAVPLVVAAALRLYFRARAGARTSWSASRVSGQTSTSSADTARSVAGMENGAESPRAPGSSADKEKKR